MPSRDLVLALALAALLAGCAAPASSPPPAAPAAVPPDSDPVIVSLDISTQDCFSSDPAWPIPLPDAQARLPQGFRAREVFGPGLGALVLNAIHCEAPAFQAAPFQMLELHLVVEPPALPEVVLTADAPNRSEPAEDDLPLNLYELAAYTDSDAMLQRYAIAGIPARKAELAQELSRPLPQLLLTEGSARDANGTLVQFRTENAGNPAEASAHRRQWHQTGEGLGLFEHDLEPALLTFGGVQCTLQPGSPMAEAAGGALCSQGRSQIVEHLAWKGRFLWFPGVQAGCNPC